MVLRQEDIPEEREKKRERERGEGGRRGEYKPQKRIDIGKLSNFKI